MHHQVLTAGNTSRRKANYILLVTFSNPILIYPSVVPQDPGTLGRNLVHPYAMDAGMGARNASKMTEQSRTRASLRLSTDCQPSRCGSCEM